jgi:hypothetical protein
MQEGVRSIEVYGTSYEIRPNEREPGVVLEILGTRYEIFSDTEGFSFYRIDPDGLAIFGREGLNSERSAIELAEICERIIAFVLNTGQSIDLVEDCVKLLKETPPK